MKTLICGLGSIGKRHLQILESFGFRCQDIAIVRTRKGTANFGDTILSEHGNRHPVYTRVLDALLAEKPDLALNTNPTSLHVSTALMAARAGCHLFIEKPNFLEYLF